jgi:hypothetical protein
MDQTLNDPREQTGRNQPIGFWSEPLCPPIPLPFTAAAIRMVVDWGSKPDDAPYTHQQIANWCTQVFGPGDDERDDSIQAAEIFTALTVDCEWHMFLVRNHSLEQLRVLDFSNVRLPVEWFVHWREALAEEDEARSQNPKLPRNAFAAWTPTFEAGAEESTAHQLLRKWYFGLSIRRYWRKVPILFEFLNALSTQLERRNLTAFTSMEILRISPHPAYPEWFQDDLLNIYPESSSEAKVFYQSKDNPKRLGLDALYVTGRSIPYEEIVAAITPDLERLVARRKQ